LNAANILIAPLFERGIANDLEIRTLAKTRDELLPKLLSGEIRIHDAEKAIGGML
jgi:type I restriction enzyme S subunit